MAAEGLAHEPAGWNAEVLELKIEQLARIIRQMNGGAGSEVLGVCEVENEHVLRFLIDVLVLTTRDYDVAHADTGDRRGIDVAFLFGRARTRDFWRYGPYSRFGRKVEIAGT